MQWGFMPEEPSVEWTVTKRRRRAIISGTFSVTRETTTCGEIMIFFFVWWGAVVEQEVRSLNSSKEEQYLCSPNEVKSKLFPLFNQFCVIATSFLLVCRLKPAYLGCGTWLYFYRHILYMPCLMERTSSQQWYTSLSTIPSKLYSSRVNVLHVLNSSTLGEHQMLSSWWLIIQSSFPHHLLNMFTNAEQKYPPLITGCYGNSSLPRTVMGTRPWMPLWYRAARRSYWALFNTSEFSRHVHR